MADPAPAEALPVRRVWAWLVLVLFLLPVAAVMLVFTEQALDFRSAERVAETQIASAAPLKASWGVLGEVRLKQGRLAEALPLLERAASLERVGGADARDTLTLAKAEIEGAQAGLPGASLSAAEQALAQAEALAPRLPEDRQAEAWFSAGMFWSQLERRDRAVADLKRAVTLQTVALARMPAGARGKDEGLLEYYQTMLAGFLER